MGPANPQLRCQQLLHEIHEINDCVDAIGLLFSPEPPLDDDGARRRIGLLLERLSREQRALLDQLESAARAPR